MGCENSGKDGGGVSKELDFCLFVTLRVDCKISNLQYSFCNLLYLTLNSKQRAYCPFPNFLRYREIPPFRFHTYKITS